MNYAPIALFVYNRPWHTRQAVNALLANAEASQTPLYVFSDAPKSHAANDAVAEVRAYIRNIVGFESVTIVEREENLGLACSTINGVSYLCEKYGRVIVIEDDLVTSPTFLKYMNNALDYYANDERVMQVAGYMFPVQLDLNDDAFFMTFISSWGWATWQRAWLQFDPDAKGYGQLVNDRKLRDEFDLKGHYSYFNMLKAQQQGKADSWAIRWYLSVFLGNGLALYPKKTLVRNLGFDGSGVNCAVSIIDGAALDSNFEVIKFPNLIEVSELQEIVVNGLPTRRISFKSVIKRIFLYLKWTM